MQTRGDILCRWYLRGGCYILSAAKRWYLRGWPNIWQGGQIFERVAKYLRGWLNILQGGQIFERVAKYLTGWPNTWQCGQIFERVAKYLRGWHLNSLLVACLPRPPSWKRQLFQSKTKKISENIFKFRQTHVGPNLKSWVTWLIEWDHFTNLNLWQKQESLSNLKSRI